MMHVDPICAYIHAYNLRILNKLSVSVNGYTFTTISHAMRWASNEDHHVI
jgi:hypothetical protein